MPAALIMAAGHGTRMRSRTPKVLHPVCGRPMLDWVVDAARGAGAERVVAVVRPGQRRRPRAAGDGVEVAEQREGEGTAAAVDAARELLSGRGHDPAALRRPPADHERPPRRAARRARGAGRRRHDAHDRGRSTPRPTGASSATRRARSPRSSRRRTRPRSRPSTSRSARSTSAPTSSTAPALFDALEQGRAGRERRALPDCRLPAARRASPPTRPTTSRAPPGSTTAPT